MNVQKELNCVNRKLNIAITRISNPDGDPNILAEFIAGQLKNYPENLTFPPILHFLSRSKTKHKKMQQNLLHL
jgi:hypothetical protein